MSPFHHETAANRSNAVTGEVLCQIGKVNSAGGQKLTCGKGADSARMLAKPP